MKLQSAKKAVRREAIRVARAEVRKAKRDLIDLQEKFGEKLMGQMQTKIQPDGENQG